MKSKTPYCTLVFHIKNATPIVDSAARIISFSEDKVEVESRFFYINKDLIESVSISLTECSNMQIAINTYVESVKKENGVAKYVLNNIKRKTFEFGGKTFSVCNQSLTKKLNIARINS